MDDWTSFLPYLGTGIAFGLATGWVVGYFTKKVAKITAFFLGLVFVLLQVLVMNHLIQVNWPDVGRAFDHIVQVTRGHQSQVWAMLLWNFPYAGSFTAGFVLGFRKG